MYGEQATPQHNMAAETPTRYGETPTPSRRWADKTPLAGGMTPSGIIYFLFNRIRLNDSQHSRRNVDSFNTFPIL